MTEIGDLFLRQIRRTLHRAGPGEGEGEGVGEGVDTDRIPSRGGSECSGFQAQTLGLAAAFLLLEKLAGKHEDSHFQNV